MEKQKNAFDTLQYISTGKTIYGETYTKITPFNPKEIATDLQNILECSTAGRSKLLTDVTLSILFVGENVICEH